MVSVATHERLSRLARCLIDLVSVFQHGELVLFPFARTGAKVRGWMLGSMGCPIISRAHPPTRSMRSLTRKDSCPPTID